MRYTPKLNIELDIAKIFDGLLRNEEFYSVFYSYLMLNINCIKSQGKQYVFIYNKKKKKLHKPRIIEL